LKYSSPTPPSQSSRPHNAPPPEATPAPSSPYTCPESHNLASNPQSNTHQKNPILKKKEKKKKRRRKMGPLQESGGVFLADGDLVLLGFLKHCCFCYYGKISFMSKEL
jgi:hypothetical protein